jgi:ribonuclease-3
MSSPTAARNARKALQKSLGYQFDNPLLLDEALTHKSYAHEQRLANGFGNERLEFLGDAVLELIVTHMLTERYSDFSEGKLSRMRAAIVNTHELAQQARRFGLGRHIRLSRGEQEQNGSDKQSILANAYEALVAAVYRDGGFAAAFAMVARHLGERIEDVALIGFVRDFKSRLQEYVQKRLQAVPQYAIVTEEGPDHSKTYIARVSINGSEYAQGRGGNKKEAEQHAAQRALTMLSGETADIEHAGEW